MTDIAPTLATLLGVDLKAPAYSRPIALFLERTERNSSPRVGERESRTENPAQEPRGAPRGRDPGKAKRSA